MGVFIFISRVTRLSSNLLFLKTYDKLKNKMLFLLEGGLALAFLLLLIGHFVGKIYGVYIMALGFFLFLTVRDPFDNLMRKTLFENSREDVHDKIVNYINVCRKIFTLIYSTIIAFMLVKLSYVYVMSLLLLTTLFFLIIVIKIYNLITKGDKNV